MRCQDLPRTVIFAHRGASRYAPENTLPAFQLAVEQGAHAVELDAKLTADGQVVVIHDNTLQRLAGVPGRLRELRLEELRLLEVGSHFDVSFRGTPIPTLDEVFETVGRRIFINIELANLWSPGDALPEKTAEIVRRHSLQEWVMFSSFNPRALVRLHRLLPQVPCGLLTHPSFLFHLERFLFGGLLRYQALHPDASTVSAGFVQACHRRGQKVNVYTVNEADQMRSLLELGADGIITDDPPLGLRMVESTPGAQSISQEAAH